MAKVKLQSAIAALSGSLTKEDGYTFRRTRKGRKGRTILIKKADMSGVEWSPAQKENRQHMKEAVAFAKSVLADPELKRAYEKRARRKGSDAYHLALSEHLRSFKKRAQGREALL